MRNIAQNIIKQLDLKPLKFEGGYFRRTYLSDDTIDEDALPDRYQRSKHMGSAIYYLLTEATYSKIHRLPTDEIFHFYLGDPVEMLQLRPNGTGEIVRIGNLVLEGFFPQVVVPKGVWQGCRLMDGGQFALMGATLAPAFDKDDFEAPENIEELLARYPAKFHRHIRMLM